MDLNEDNIQCNESAVAYALSTDNTNNNSSRLQLDRHVHWAFDEKISLYGIFSGYNGDRVAELSKEVMTKYLISNLKDTNSDEQIKYLLRNAFKEAEKKYNQENDNLLATKNALQNQLNSKYDQIIQHKIEEMNKQLSIGCSVILCLIFEKKMFISNVGACRALLCKFDENNKPRVIQYSVDHNIYNEEELSRLRDLKLNKQTIEKWTLPYTRCIGSIAAKNLYKDIPLLKMATSMPVTTEEEIVGPIPVEDSFQFLLLLSSGLCKTLKDIILRDVTQENREIIRITAEEFRQQSTIEDVSSKVIEKILEKHRNIKTNTTKQDEITLLVRRFNVDMPHLRPLQDTRRQEKKTSDIVDAHVDFEPYYRKVEEAKKAGKLPEGIDFF